MNDRLLRNSWTFLRLSDYIVAIYWCSRCSQDALMSTVSSWVLAVLMTLSHEHSEHLLIVLGMAPTEHPLPEPGPHGIVVSLIRVELEPRVKQVVLQVLGVLFRASMVAVLLGQELFPILGVIVDSRNWVPAALHAMLEVLEIVGIWACLGFIHNPLLHPGCLGVQAHESVVQTLPVPRNAGADTLGRMTGRTLASSSTAVGWGRSGYQIQ